MKNSKGFSLVELMVSLTLGLVLIGGVVTVVTSSQSGYQELVEQGRMQETAKLAMDYIIRDLRNVGYWGCAGNAIPTANTLEKGTTDFFRKEDALKGWNNYENEPDTDSNAVTGVPVLYANAHGHTVTVRDPDDMANTAVRRPDIIEMRVISLDGALSVKQQQGGSAAIILNKPHGYPQGTIWAVVEKDCSNMAVFSQSGAGGNSHTITHTTGANPIAKNCTKYVKGNFTCDNFEDNELKTGYSSGSGVFVVTRVAYTVEDSASGQSALFRRTPTLDEDNDGSTVDQIEELIHGISDLRFTYGLDVNGDGNVDRFADARTINEQYVDLVDNETLQAGADDLCDPTVLCFWQAISIQIEVEVTPLNSELIPPQRFTTSLRLRNRGI